MAYRRGHKSIREAYEERFPVMDTREVTFRVDNIEKRTSMSRPEPGYDRGYEDDPWYGGSRNYSEGYYPSNDRRYMDDNPNFGSFHRNSSPPRNEGQYSNYSSNRDDSHLRRQVEYRNGGRGPYFRRGRGSAPPQRSGPDRKAKPLLSHPFPDSGEDRDDYRRREPYSSAGDHSPRRREPHPPLPLRTIVNTSSRSFSPDRDKGHNYQQAQKRRQEEVYSSNRELDKPNVLTSNSLPGSADESSHSSAALQEKNPASVAETEEVVSANVEPKLTPEEDFKARRSEAIKVKAQEIEKLYQQDCETFATVVKMLIDKEPSMEKQLQESLDKNLLEMKQHCLDDLKHFIKELDQVIQQPETSV